MAKQLATGPVDGPWALPDGWRWEAISTVCRPTEKGSPASRFAESFRYTDVGGIGEGGEAKVVSIADAPSRARQFVRPGDTLFSGVRVNLRRTVFTKPDMTDVASTAFSVMSPGSEIEPGYLFRWMTSDFLVNSLIPLQRGSQPPAVLDDDVRAQPIAVPPLEVQRRIVARIDELFAEIDDGEAALARARDDLATWRKALLKAAVTGELTAGWRAANPPTETGTDLLTRILAKRRARSEAEPRNRGNRYVEPAGPDIATLPTLPVGWVWTNIAQLAIVDSGGTPPGIEAASAPTGEVPWFKVSSMSLPGNETELQASHWWLSREQARKSNLRIFPAGSLVFPKLGGALLTNKRRLLAIDGCLDLNNMAVSPMLSMGEYISALFSGIDLADLSDGSVVPQLKRQAVESIAIALPPVSELAELVRRLRAAFGEVSELGADASELKIVSATLRQSILAAAFRGDLA